MPIKIEFKYDERLNAIFTFRDESIKSKKNPEMIGLYVSFNFPPALLLEKTLIDLPNMLRQKAMEVEKLVKYMIDKDNK